MSTSVDGTESTLDSDLDIFRAVCRSTEEKFKLCIDLEKKNARLTAELTTNEEAQKKLQSDYDALSQDALKLQDNYNSLKESKVEYEGQIDRLLTSVKRCQSIIDMSLTRIRKLETQLHESGAREETLNIYLDALEQKQEVLEEELASLQSLKKDTTLQVDNESRTLKGHNVDQHLVAATTSSQEHAVIETLQNSLGRLTRRHERLIAKKESAEKKFYASYVEWHDFKAWWCEFSKFPGVAPRIRAFNKETRNGTLARSGSGEQLQVQLQQQQQRQPQYDNGTTGKEEGIRKEINSRVVKVANSEDRDPKGMFRALEHVVSETEGEEGGQIATTKLSREKVGSIQRSPEALRNAVRNVTERLEQVCKEAETQCDSSPVKRPESRNANAIGDEDEEDEEDALGAASRLPQTPSVAFPKDKDSFDLEKTQETTPSKSPRHSFKFDLTGVRLPTLDLYPSSTTTKQPIPPRLPSPDSPIEIKEESPIKEALLRRAIEAPGSATRHGHALLSKALDTLPSTSLGKRKASSDDVGVSTADLSARKAFVPLFPQYLDGTKVAAAMSNKRQHREESPVTTPNSHRKPKTVKEKGDTSIAGRFEVNPAKNNGVNYAYEEVVRKKADRRRMEATDCDQCRNYYKAVGPLPPRLQPPLWKSPTHTQEAAKDQPRRCKHHMKVESDDDEEVDRDTAVHQNQVSRHRVVFTAGADPVDYWEIGFPDTQRVKEINAQAEKSHKKKEKMMEKEAQKPDGRYRYRK